LAVASANVGAGVHHIILIHAFLAYLSTLSVVQWIGLAAAIAAVIWSIWWALQPEG